MLTIFNLKRIRYKLVFIYTALIIGILIPVAAITYASTIDIIKNQSITLNNKLVELGRDNLDTNIEEVDKIFRSLYLDDAFLKYLASSSTNDEYDTIDTYQAVQNSLNTLLNSRRDIYSIIYVEKNGFVVYTTKNEAGYKKLLDRSSMPEWFDSSLNALESSKGERLVLPTHSHIPIDFRVTDNTEKVFAIARPIINVEKDFSVKGALFINLDVSYLNKLSQEIKPFNSAFTYIVSRDGTVVFDSSGEKTAGTVDKNVLDILGPEKGNSLVHLAGEKYIAIFTTSQVSDWKIVNFIPADLYSANVSFVTKMVIIICLIALMLSAVITLFVSRRISNPIEKLSATMDKIDLANMNLRVDESRRDEIGKLSRSFNSLIIKLKDAIHREYESNLRQKDAEMKALQAQINPHFLYNVLQSMSSIAVLNNIDEINIMAKALGKMLRYSIKTEENFVPVAEEIDHVTSYLAIQKVRFGDRLSYMVDIPEYFKEYKILKLSLQPLVENAIIHGFDGKQDKGVICINGYQDNEYLVFEVSDDGKGLDAAKLNEISNELDNADNAFYSEDRPSIGLKNVLIRLKILYRGNASLSMESEPDVGTCVRIRFPAKLQEGDQA